MKIALLTPTFCKFSGIDRVVEMHAEEYVKQGHRVSIFCLNSDIHPKGYNIYYLNKDGRVFRLFMFAYKRYFKEWIKMLKGYDFIRSYLYPMNLLPIWANKPWTYYNCGVATPNLFPTIHERFYMKLFRFYTNNTIRGASFIISISEYLRNIMILENNRDSNVKYIKVNKMYKRNKKIKKNKDTLLYVGRLSPHKGIHLLLEAFDMIVSEKPNTKLIIAGKKTFNKYYKELEKKAHKNIKFVGYVEDKKLLYYYNKADVYVTCSLWEGFDMPIVEAEKCGTPTVAFDIGSHKEVIKKGVLVKARDTEAFAKEVIKYVC